MTSSVFETKRRTQDALIAFLVGTFLTACGAATTAAPTSESTARPAPEPEARADHAALSHHGDTDTEPAALAPAPEPTPPPEPEPVVIEAGRALGPIRIDMSEEAVRALALEERPADPRSRFFGPYRVFFDARGVRRIEARIGDLGRIRIGDRVFASGTHIHELRDAFGDCEWTEGGGERYRCAGGTLFVQTAHTMNPARYIIAVERR